MAVTTTLLTDANVDDFVGDRLLVYAGSLMTNPTACRCETHVVPAEERVRRFATTSSAYATTDEEDTLIGLYLLQGVKDNMVLTRSMSVNTLVRFNEVITGWIDAAAARGFTAAIGVPDGSIRVALLAHPLGFTVEPNGVLQVTM